MFDKNNANYKLYLAGIINESEYMDLHELEFSDPKLNPTSKSIFGSREEEEDHDPEIGAAKMKYKAFLEALKDLPNPKAAALLGDFMSEFLTHTKMQDLAIKKIVLSALEGRHE